MSATLAASCSATPQAANAAADNVAQGSDNLGQTGLQKIPLTIHSASGQHRFTVEVASTPEEQAAGLMFRRSLGPEEGMLFPRNPPEDVGFWMKNTFIPLDLIFIRADGRIASIGSGVPHSLQPVMSGEPVAAVLEIRGGRSAELGIKPGDRVDWAR